MLYSPSSALWILTKHAPKYCVVVVLKTLGVGVFYTLVKGVPAIHHNFCTVNIHILIAQIVLMWFV